ncbi:MAG TPA: hemolysin D [Saprospirales bacterium]|nr:hemolysin D [Saprospirales bacterium]
MKDNNIEGTIEHIDIHKYSGAERTEEVRDIIERMPTKFGLWISIIVIGLFSLMMLFGWIIRYPDIVRGQVTINTAVSPIKLVANNSGKLKLNDISSQSAVETNDIIGYIDNATSYDTLLMIQRIIAGYNPSNPYNTSILSRLPSKVALGELTSKYYNFLSNLHQINNFNKDRIYDKQIASLQNLHSDQRKEVANSGERIDIGKKSLEHSYNFYKRDSLLMEQKASSEAEIDKSRLDYLNTQTGYANARSNQIEAEKQAQQTLSKITEVNVQKSEKRKELEIALLASYNDLIDNIALWEQRYLFKAPFAGKVQFLKFWTNDQFVQAGEPVFTIIPGNDEPYGQVSLPAYGAGKVQVGQEVIIKLDDFPYNEYGSVTGAISSISLTTNTEKTQQGNIETYLVTVKFPKGLVTNYGKKLTFKHESRGTAEIITKDRRLIERLFDNLKYVVEK